MSESPEQIRLSCPRLDCGELFEKTGEHIDTYRSTSDQEMVHMIMKCLACTWPYEITFDYSMPDRTGIEVFVDVAEDEFEEPPEAAVLNEVRSSLSTSLKYV